MINYATMHLTSPLLGRNMHEYSVVVALIEQCERYAKQSQVREISTIVVGLGVHSGIEPMLLQSAFDTFKEESPYTTNANLEMQTLPIILHCHACGTDSQPETSHYGKCLECDSTNVTITQGQEMLLLRLEMLE